MQIFIMRWANVILKAGILLIMVSLSNCKIQKGYIHENVEEELFSKTLVNTFKDANRPDYLLIEDALFTIDSERSTKLRMIIYVEKDEMIFLSGRMMGFEIFRFKVTMDSVYYINRIDKSYFNSNIVEFTGFIPEDIDFITIQDFLYTGILQGNKLSKNFINKEFGYLNDLWVFRKALDNGIGINLFYNQEAKLKKLKYLDSEREISIDLDIEKSFDQSARFNCLYDNKENRISLNLEYSSIIYKPFRKTDFKISNSYNEKRGLF